MKTDPKSEACGTSPIIAIARLSLKRVRTFSAVTRPEQTNRRPRGTTQSHFEEQVLLRRQDHCATRQFAHECGKGEVRGHPTRGYNDLMRLGALKRRRSSLYAFRPEMTRPAPTTTRMMLTAGETFSSLWVVTPTCTSPALTPWCSECGNGTKNERTPSTSTSTPMTSRAFTSCPPRLSMAHNYNAPPRPERPRHH